MRRATATTTGASYGVAAGAAGRALGWVLVAVALAGIVGVLAGASPRLVLCASIAIAGAVAIYLWPLASLLAILALKAGNADSVFIDLLALAAGAIALVLAAPGLPLRRVTLPLALFLLVALPSLPIEPSADEGARPAFLLLPLLDVRYMGMPSEELLAWLRIAGVLVILLLSAWAVRDRRGLDLLVGAVLASAVMPLAIAFRQLATGELQTRAGFDAVAGPFTHPNYFAFYLLVVLAVGIVVLLETRSLPVKLSVGALVSLCTACLFLTYTRSAWIAFAAILLVLGALRYPRLFVVGGIALLAAAFAYPVTVDRVQERFSDLSGRSGASSTNSWEWRTGQWERMIPYGSEQPVTGQGFNSYPRVTVREFGASDPDYPTIAEPSKPATSPRGFTAHNDYVKSWVELGAPGLILWSAVLVGLLTSMIAAWRVPEVRPLATAMIAVALVLIGVSVSDNIQGYTVVQLYTVALVGGIAGVAARTSRLSGPRGGELRPAGD